MIQSPENYLLVEIEKKFQDTSGNILIDTSWEPQEYASIEGIVVSVPHRTKGDERKLFGTVKIGDRVFFSYDTIYDYEQQPADDTPVYRNLVLYQGQEYWKVDIRDVFCVITDEGMEMVTENLLIEPLAEDAGRIKALPKDLLSCNVRDVVCFEPRFVQKYNILGSEHYIIPARRVLAKLN